MRELIKAIIPPRLLRAYRNARYGNPDPYASFRSSSAERVFTRVYQSGVWGAAAAGEQKFYSGTGSDDSQITDAYVEAVTGFLSEFSLKPDVVDLGCGDFLVGARIRPSCGRYTACDVVPALIKFNTAKYSDLGVEFLHLDMSRDRMPPGEVVFVRQVFQHLSNDQILRTLRGITATYKALVLTEHIPRDPQFKPNLDKPAGPDIRLGFNSGIVLTSPPFNLVAQRERILCEVPEGAGVIRTIAYEL